MDIVGRNKKIIEEYIKNQIQEDITYKRLSLKEHMEPFTGGLVNKVEKIKHLLGAVNKGVQLSNGSMCE